jgi:glyoxylase-like metal-dependent hydrolase (beta-lactamase superfamily II)
MLATGWEDSLAGPFRTKRPLSRGGVRDVASLQWARRNFASWIFYICRAPEGIRVDRIIIAALAGGAMLFAGIANAQQTGDFSKVEIKVTDLGNKIYVLEGQGGNITVAIGADGIIMVDTQFAPLHNKIKAAIEKLSPLPIKYVINTHFHCDHTGGNEAFGKDGAIVVAHENVKTRLAAGALNNVSGDLVPPAPVLALPKETYKDTMTVRLVGRTAELKHPMDVHTDGDTYINFPDANVLVAGDLVFFAGLSEHRLLVRRQYRWADSRR